MHARRSVSLLLASTVTALLGVSAYADDDPQAPAVQAVATDSAVTSAAPESVVTPKAPDAVADSTTTPAVPASNDGFGVAMTSDQLDNQRGGDALVGQNYLTGTVASNTASRVETGSNSISEGSFASSSGLPTVIQNTGANVLIQNATVLNVRFGN